MNNSTVLHKPAGLIIPEALVAAALKACPTCSGMAVRDADGIEHEYFEKTTTVDNIMKLQNFAKDSEILLFLANFTDKFDMKKDIQPFVLKDGADRSILAYAFEGDFPKYADPSGTRSDEGNVSEKYIEPMLFDMYENVGGDEGKFFAKLHSPMFKAQVEAIIGARGTFAFLPLIGPVVAIGQNDLGMKDGENGWSTSQRHGYGDPVKEKSPITSAAATVVSKAKKFSSFLSGTTEPAKKADEPKPEAPHPDAPAKEAGPVSNPPPIEVPKTETKINADTRVAVKVPAGLEKNAKNAWLRLFFNAAGELPKNHQDKNCAVLVEPNLLPYAQKDVKTKADVESMQKAVSAIRKGQAAPIEAVAALAAPAKTSDGLPSLSDAEMTETTKLLAGWMDRDKGGRPNPLQIQESEAPWPLFSEKFGIPLTDVMWIQVPDLVALCNGSKSAAMMIIELRRKYAETIDVKALVGTAKPVATGQPPMVPKEIPAQQSKTAPAANNFLGLKRAS